MDNGIKAIKLNKLSKIDIIERAFVVYYKELFSFCDRKVQSDELRKRPFEGSLYLALE
jgi:hypothetical protein